MSNRMKLSQLKFQYIVKQNPTMQIVWRNGDTERASKFGLVIRGQQEDSQPVTDIQARSMEFRLLELAKKGSATLSAMVNNYWHHKFDKH